MITQCSIRNTKLDILKRCRFWDKNLKSKVILASNSCRIKRLPSIEHESIVDFSFSIKIKTHHHKICDKSFSSDVVIAIILRTLFVDQGDQHLCRLLPAPFDLVISTEKGPSEAL
jgi:hypothetical protein